jgi:acyl dehydratase
VRKASDLEPLVDLPHSTCIPARRLAAFQDRLILRDTRSRARHPSLVPSADGSLTIAGPFDLRRHIVPTRARGVRFAEATGDPNPIHREGEVVPGAFLAAQMLSALEVLLPALRIESLRVSFTGICWYGRGVRLTMRCTPVLISGTQGLRVEASARQDDREVSTAVLEGRFEPRPARLELALHKVDTGWLGRVLDFYIALGLDPQAYLQKDEGADLSYPLGFLASLPSGSMVKRFQGEGGVLNRLTLEFDKRKLPLAGPPEVSLEMPSRIRQSFTKILTFVREGLDTAVRGTALVLPRAPLDLLTRRPEPRST